MISRKKGFGKFEVLTMIVVLLAIFAYLMCLLLGGVSKQKIDTMKDNAISFAKTAATNFESFHNFEVVYLNEVVEEGLLKNIKNPFDSGYCDQTESKVELRNGQPYVTLKCGEYLIDEERTNSKADMKVYAVGEWSAKKTGKDIQEKQLYNCIEGEKELYSEYKEELQMVSRINKDYQSDFYYASDIAGVCKPVSKTFYRTKELVEE